MSLVDLSYLKDVSEESYRQEIENVRNVFFQRQNSHHQLLGYLLDVEDWKSYKNALDKFNINFNETNQKFDKIYQVVNAEIQSSQFYNDQRSIFQTVQEKVNKYTNEINKFNAKYPSVAKDFSSKIQILTNIKGEIYNIINQKTPFYIINPEDFGILAEEADRIDSSLEKDSFAESLEKHTQLFEKIRFTIETFETKNIWKDYHDQFVDILEEYNKCFEEIGQDISNFAKNNYPDINVITSVVRKDLRDEVKKEIDEYSDNLKKLTDAHFGEIRNGLENNRLSFEEKIGKTVDTIEKKNSDTIHKTEKDVKAQVEALKNDFYTFQKEIKKEMDTIVQASKRSVVELDNYKKDLLDRFVKTLAEYNKEIIESLQKKIANVQIEDAEQIQKIALQIDKFAKDSHEEIDKGIKNVLELKSDLNLKFNYGEKIGDYLTKASKDRARYFKAFISVAFLFAVSLVAPIFIERVYSLEWYYQIILRLSYGLPFLWVLHFIFNHYKFHKVEEIKYKKIDSLIGGGSSYLKQEFGEEDKDIRAKNFHKIGEIFLNDDELISIFQKDTDPSIKYLKKVSGLLEELNKLRKSNS